MQTIFCGVPLEVSEIAGGSFLDARLFFRAGICSGTVTFCGEPEKGGVVTDSACVPQLVHVSLRENIFSYRRCRCQKHLR